MATEALQQLVVALGLDASDFQQSVQQVSQAISDGLGGSLEEVQPLVEDVLDGFAEGFQEAAQEAGVLGEEGAQAVGEIEKGAKEAAQTIRRDLPQATRQATAQMTSHLDGVASKFKNFAMQIVTPIAGAFAISGAVSTFMNGAMAAKEQAQEIGVATDELQLWQGAITRAGGNVNKFEMSLRRMALSGKAAGDPLQAMYKLAGDAEKMSRDAFTAKAKELGIDVATIGVLIQGRKALDEHLKRAKEIGIYEQRHIELAEKLKIGLWELNGSFDGLKNELLSMVLPAMAKVLNWLTDFTLMLSNHAPMVAAAIGVIAAALSVRLLPQILKVTLAFAKWAPAIGIIIAIAAVIDDLYAYMHGGHSALEDFWKQFGTGPELLEKFSAAWRDLKKWGGECLQGLIAWSKQLWATLEKWGVIDDLKSAFTGLAHIIHGVLTKNWEEAGQGVRDFCSGMIAAIWGAMLSIGEMILKGIINAFNAALDWIKENFTWKRIFGGFGEIGQELAEAAGDLDEGEVNGREMGERAAAAVTRNQNPEAAKKEIKSVWDFADQETEEYGQTAKRTAGEAQDALVGAADAAGSGMVSAANRAQAAWSATLAAIGAGIDALAASAQAMGAGGMVPAFAGVRAAYAGGNVSNSSSSVNIGTMNVSTQATDANGMARGVRGAFKRNRLVGAAQGGTNQK